MNGRRRGAERERIALHFLKVLENYSLTLETDNLSRINDNPMKRLFLLAALIAATVLPSCKAQETATTPSALDVIMTRTSIRNFTGDPVSKEQLETILKAGMAAPTAMNGQPWRFVVVTDKDRIAELFGGGPRSGMFTTAGAVIVVCGQTTMMR